MVAAVRIVQGMGRINGGDSRRRNTLRAPPAGSLLHSAHDAAQDHAVLQKELLERSALL
jgi:hypothetical protein